MFALEGQISVLSRQNANPGCPARGSPSGPQKVSRNAPKTTLLTRTPWPRNFPEIFPRRACLSDPCFNVQILCISFKIQILCTLFHRHYRIVKHICTNAKNCQEVLRVTARILHNVKGGCGWDWMRVVVLCSRTQLTPPHPTS